MRACVIFNPAARGDKAGPIRARLEALPGEVVIRPTAGPGTAVGLAQEAVAAGFDTVVAAGGDGTVNEVVNGLAAAPQGLERVRLAVLPLGTVNVFARELTLPTNLEAAWALTHEGAETRLDLPQVEFRRSDPPRRLYFVQLAGAGLDARAVARVSWRWKKRVGPLAYALAGFQAWRGPQPVVTAQVGDTQVAGEAVLVGNGRLYGGSVVMFAGADPRDGLLEVRVLPRVTWRVLAGFGWCYALHRPFRFSPERCWRAAEFELSSNARVPVELDGELSGELPAHVSLRPRALRVITAG